VHLLPHARFTLGSFYRPFSPLGQHTLPLTKCRKILGFEKMPFCGAYLSNTTTYFEVNEEYDSLVEQIMTGISNVMSFECASNLASFLCQSRFKECAEVQDPFSGEALWLPSLLVSAYQCETFSLYKLFTRNFLPQKCRSECERHSKIWEACVAEIEDDVNVQQAFNDLMEAVVRCIFFSYGTPSLLQSSHDPLPPPCYTGTKITQWSFLEIIDFGKGLLVSFYAVAQLRS
jgi:hypothetical protein